MAKATKLGLNAAWAMAVGGMIGGGMFATLGLMLNVAGQSAWMSFIAAGLLAYATGHSYAQLTTSWDVGGGLYRFLERLDRPSAATVAVIALIAAYVLSTAVYAYTFGAYVAEIAQGLSWLAPTLAVSSILAVALVNLAGTAQASIVEVISVWVKLAILVGVAAVGFAQFDAAPFVPETFDWSQANSVLLGAATVFMAFQGFQLLSYDYADLQDRRSTLPRAFGWAVLTTTLAYVFVTVGGVLLVGVDTIVEHQEIALVYIGQQAFGRFGFYLTIAAAGLATITAINATLFATARLARDAAQDGRLPGFSGSKDSMSLRPFIIGLSAIAIVLAVIGGLDNLIRLASFLFIAVFGGVNFIAYRQCIPGRWISLAGLLGCILFIALLASRHLS